ncbi:ATP-dependent zinc metalloprotease FtsH [bioreactor metagenome]|uniref:ATP-dependent zinc metalloprotease FtsH n=1 Tax=bioreactor metagenome TaxID=1076179 RepID=A0A645I8E9_9ZZZZ
MVTRFGMSEELGPVSFASGSDEVFLGRDYTHMRNYSETVAAAIDKEVNRFISDAYDRTETILSDHRDKLHKVANTLLEEEKIEGKRFLEIMDDEQKEGEDTNES